MSANKLNDIPRLSEIKEKEFQQYGIPCIVFFNFVGFCVL